MKKSQTGSAHLVIIIALVIVVLGALGFIFWQNFINKPVADKTSETSTTQTTQTSNEDKSDTAKSLTVTEWSVKGSYVSDHTVSYSVNQFGGLAITDASLSDDCSQLGSISRGVASDEAIVGSTSSGETNQEAYDAGDGSARAHVGDYYYFYTGPQAACADDEAGQSEAVNAVKAFVTSLKAV